MNNQLQEFARDELKKGLKQCTEGEQYKFKRMYANGKLDMEINEVVDNMPEEKLDRAMEQVEKTLEKKQRKN